MEVYWNRGPSHIVETSMKRIGLIAITAVLASACLGTDFADSLEGSWLLQSGTSGSEPILILPSHPITMTLDGSQVTGTAACNSYGGSYRVSSRGDFQLVDGLSITEMACSPDEVMESETQFMTAMLAVEKVSLDGGILTLSGGGYELNFVTNPDAPPSADPGSDDPDDPVSSVAWFGEETYGDWVLVTGQDGDAEITSVEGTAITLSVDASGFGGSSGCNSYGFALPLPADGSFPPIVSTMKLCEPSEIMDAEAAYLAALQRYESSSIVDGQLVIVGDEVELIYDPA
jgi:heat shock protein HslJ